MKTVVTLGALAIAAAIPAQRNPLSPRVDRFAGRFESSRLQVEIEPAAKGGYRGEIRFGGETYPLVGRTVGAELHGEFESGGHRFRFSAAADADGLALTTGGMTHRLARAGRRADAPTGRLAAADGTKRVAANRWRDPNGWFGFDLPQGWSVQGRDGRGMLINPGLRSTDRLDAIVAVLYGLVDRSERSRDAASLLRSRGDLVRQLLASQGIQVGRGGDVETVKTHELEGAVRSWRGRSVRGDRVEVFGGIIVKRGIYLGVLAVVREGEQRRFMPGAKQLFTSMDLTPPPPNPQAARALAGRSFSGSNTHSSIAVGASTFATTYAFGPGGGVSRRTMYNGAYLEGGHYSDATSGGSYEVLGNLLLMTFEDGTVVAELDRQGFRIGNQVFR